MIDALAEIRKAQLFAQKAHGSQKYGNRPYMVHLIDVATTLIEECQSTDIELSQAGFLHDVVEDTPITIGEVEDDFGARVADLVWAVTGIGKTRVERNRSMHDKVHKTPDAAMLKCCDRLANMRACLRSGSLRHIKMYSGEFPEFVERVVNPALPLPASLVTSLHLANDQLLAQLQSRKE